jgi:hypothetical protein
MIEPQRARRNRKGFPKDSERLSVDIPNQTSKIKHQTSKIIESGMNAYGWDTSQ